MKSAYAGFDIGSSSVHCAVLDQDGKVLHLLPSLPHLGNPMGCIREQWETLLESCPPCALASTAFTGIGSRFIKARFPEAMVEKESVTIPRGAAFACPETRFLFHIGARDSFFFRLATIRGETVVTEWATNTKCGGGSGTLLEKQVRRLYGKETAAMGGEGRRLLASLFAEASKEAGSSPGAPAYNARCGIIIQSDLIHDQNEGLPRPLILSRLLSTLLRNFKNDVVGGSRLDEAPALVSGGVFTFSGLAERLESLLGIPLRRPEWVLHAGAMGAAHLAMRQGNRTCLHPDLLEEALVLSRCDRAHAAPLAESLSRVFIVPAPVPGSGGKRAVPG